MNGDTITLLEAAILCVLGMSVIFLVLFLLSCIIKLVSWLLNKQKKQENHPAPAQPEQAAPAPAGLGHLDVVLITAAVAASLGKRSDEIVVHSIRRIGAEETMWSRSGRLDSMQS